MDGEGRVELEQLRRAVIDGKAAHADCEAHDEGWRRLYMDVLRPQ